MKAFSALHFYFAFMSYFMGDRNEGKIKKSDENTFIKNQKWMKMPSCR